MQLFHWHAPRGNFGDDMNQWFWDDVLPGWRDWAAPGHLIGVGSLLTTGLALPAGVKIVAGAGAGYGQPPPMDPADWDIRFVRGPRTAAALGLPADTPAATIERATRADQRTTVGTLATLPALAVQQGVKAPALIFIGVHLVEANLVTPLVLGKRLTINPLLILVSLSFWGWVWGTPGALLAVPLLLILQTILASTGTPDLAGFLFEHGTLTTAEEVRDAPFVGVVGHELLSRYVVEVNYDRHEVVLHDPETYEYTGNGRIVHADISGRQPFVDADITAPDGASYTARMHVDSGAGIVASLFPSTNAAIVPPQDGKEKNACFVGGKATYLTGTSVEMALGDGPAVTTPVDYATGGEVIDTGQNGRLGARFLRNYNVVFDYSRERMILEPRAATVALR